MKVLWIVALVAATIAAGPQPAATAAGATAVATPYVLPTATASPAADLVYDDPGMHFRAPDGWKRVRLAPNADPDGKKVVLFVLSDGKNVSKSITITINEFDGSLGEFSDNRQGELRQASQDSSTAVYIKKRLNTTLANGMPATEFIWTLTSDTKPIYKSYEYCIIDTYRSIDVTYNGLESDVHDADAAAALSSLYVVSYPHSHPTY